MQNKANPSNRRLEITALGIIFGYIGYSAIYGGLDFYQHLGLSQPEYLSRYAYPQWLTLLFRLLFGSLPPHLAFAIYATVSGLVLFFAYRQASPSPRWLLGLCLWPLTMITIGYGQITPYLLLGLVLSLSRNGWSAGLLSSLLWLKPQLAVGIGLVHFSRRDWRALLIYILLGAIVILASLLAPGKADIGSDFWKSWFLENQYSTSITGIVGFWPVQIMLFVLAMTIAFSLAWRKKLSSDLALYLNLGFVPYLLGYDLPLLSPLLASPAPALSLFISTIGLPTGKRGMVIPFGGLALFIGYFAFTPSVRPEWGLAFWVLLAISLWNKADLGFLARSSSLARLLALTRGRSPYPPRLVGR